MIKHLIKMANSLDSMGLKREANAVDSLIRKIAGESDNFENFTDVEDGEMIPEEIVEPVRRKKIKPPNLASPSEIERMNRHREEEILREKRIADRNRMFTDKELLYQDLE